MPRSHRILPALAAAGALALAGCSAGDFPTPTATPSETVTPTPVVTVEPTPVTVAPLPSNALLRASVTALAPDGSNMRIVMTVRTPRYGTGARAEIERVLESCPNAVESQLEVYPGMEPTGVIVSEIEAVGEWRHPVGVGISAGGFIANLGVGPVMAPALDPADGFGCTIPVLTRPGRAETISLLLGDPAVPDAQDVATELARAIFGVQEAPDDATVTWRDCVVQLSAYAERLAEGWYPPDEWGRGCLIGYGGGA